MQKELSKDEMINLYETLPEDTLKKLGIYAKAKEAYEEKQRLHRLRQERIDKAKALVKEAQELLKIYGLELTVTRRGGLSIKDEDGQKIYGTRSRATTGTKIKKGEKTPNCRYKIPILQSIVELGAKGRAKEVLEKVFEKMENEFNSYDMETLSSGTDKRWHNTARWTRAKMVEEGLLSSKSPNGIWRITEKGRKYLEENNE